MFIKLTLPHVHYIVTVGGVNHDSKWVKLKNDDTFLFLVKALSRVFRAKFLKGIMATLLTIDGYGNIITDNQSDKTDQLVKIPRSHLLLYTKGITFEALPGLM